MKDELPEKAQGRTVEGLSGKNALLYEFKESNVGKYTIYKAAAFAPVLLKNGKSVGFADDGHLALSARLEEFQTHEIELKVYISQLQNELSKERNENAHLRVGIEAVRELMNESTGVAGLHMSDDIATWEDLEQGGTFEEWLLSFNKAEDFLGV